MSATEQHFSDPEQSRQLTRRLGRYQLTERLGGGGLAAVYRAVATDSGQLVAVKVLPSDADELLRQRFEQEARTHSQLHHPNILPILEIGAPQNGENAYFVMPLVEGPSLAQLFEEHGRLTVHEGAALLAPLARALGYAHARGIVHRDVKPSNVLLQPATAQSPGALWTALLGQFVVPLLADFGIARALDAPDLTSPGRTIGTPIYMSPEQCADSHELDGRSDLYALGAIFYHALVGRPPFSGSTTQILHAHVYEPLTLPESLLSALPQAAIEVLRLALAKAPESRYPNGEAMASALEQIGGEPPPAGELTATMMALPTVQSQARVLVPGVWQRTASAVGRAPERAPERAVLRPAAARRQRRWVGLLLGGLLSSLVLVAGFWSARVVWPALRPAEKSDSVGEAAATPPASNPVQQETAAPPAAPSAAAEAVPGTPPTPVGKPSDFWRVGEEAFAVRDWRSAVDAYTLVRRMDPQYEPTQLDAHLFESRVGLAAEALAAGELTKAFTELDQALRLRPEATAVVRVQRALDERIDLPEANAEPARRNLWRALLLLADELAAQGRPCTAAAQLEAALAILPSAGPETPLAQIQAACVDADGLQQLQPALAAAGGKILYSTQEGSRYNIYAAPARQNSPSSLLIADGAQVGARLGSPRLAFHSTAAPGIALFDLQAAFGPGDWAGRLTETAEDARDAPPSWSPDTTQIVYSSARTGAGRPRIYVRTLSSGEEIDLGLGKDPAWEPGGNRIVYNGFDELGENPGLYRIEATGQGRVRLTDNGNDVRPVWAPDGRSVVFMSTRDGDMELYRLSLVDGSLLQLTDDPAQDGLPAVSPDSSLVVFASDRGGSWRLYVTPLQGGPTIWLLEIRGVLTNWLEHSLQWTR